MEIFAETLEQNEVRGARREEDEQGEARLTSGEVSGPILGSAP